MVLQGKLGEMGQNEKRGPFEASSRLIAVRALPDDGAGDYFLI